ncbi:protein neprosin-like isoform X2 [Lycium barbarum]|uniref:protein neprosin-like isoform X2 n=1 Tax=Lycium barbarum TaxID=112863 RepID=UPI00293F54A0|nr:protein neprosin-like isoform X2 [Lycium barbarum]
MLIRQRIVRQTLLVLYFLLSYDGVQGEIKLSKLEDLEMEKQLKLLNKPAVKTIKTKYGDTYDCVDFYKQPAFDHPLLRNRNFHPKMKPTLARTLQNSNTSAANKSLNIWLKENGCPFGTVPIKRVTKDDLIRQRHIPPPEGFAFESTLSNLATVQIPYDPNNKFAGAGMSATLWNPHIESQQHTACRLKIQKGSDILQAGWRVDPTLYRDTKTRSFIHFQAGNTHCFNTLCPGFVIVNSKFPVDVSFDTIQQRGDKKVWEITLFIERDLANGNWWLLYDVNNEQIGFWPQEIFTKLTSFANNVEWGGVAYSSPSVSEPPMGSSCFPVGDPAYDAYCRRLNVLNDKGQTVHIDKTNVRVTDPNHYGIMDEPHWRGAKYQHMVFYGGPGGFETLC